MRKFRTWKRMQSMVSSEKKSIDLFLKEELPDSRSIVRDIMNTRPIIDFEIYRSNIIGIFKEKRSETITATDII